MAKKTRSATTAKSPVSKTKKIVKDKKASPVSTPLKASSGTFVPSSTTALAISELAKFLTRQAEKTKDTDAKLSLFDDEDDDASKILTLEVNTKKYVSDKPQFKPRVVELAHPIYDRTSTRSCLIVRDEVASNEALIEILEKENLPTVSQILPVLALKTEYKPFEKKRELQAEYDLFLVDQAIFNLMPTVLGKTFYKNSNLKIPIPVKVTSTSSKDQISVTALTNSLERALNGSAYLPPLGTSISFKIGSINNAFEQKQLVENVDKALTAFQESDVVSVMLKTRLSPSVPIYYTKKLYSKEDVVTEDKVKKSEVKKTNTFEEALLELAPADEVKKVLNK